MVVLSLYCRLVDQPSFMSVAYLSDIRSTAPAVHRPPIENIVDDYGEEWIGYPLTEEVVYHTPTLYFRERCRLHALFKDIQQLIFNPSPQDDVAVRDFATAVDILAGNMRRWYENLSQPLHYKWPMSIAVWDLQ